METLRYNDKQIEYPADVAEVMKKTGAKPAAVQVEEDYKRSMVRVQVGDTWLSLTLRQARDLALAIRQAANRVERHDMDRGVYKGKGGRRCG